MPGVLWFMGSQTVRHDRETELYNVVLVSAVQQRESAICIHISPPRQVFLPPPLPIPPGHHRAELPVLYCFFGCYFLITHSEQTYHICQSPYLNFPSTYFFTYPCPVQLSIALALAEDQDGLIYLPAGFGPELAKLCFILQFSVNL